MFKTDSVGTGASRSKDVIGQWSRTSVLSFGNEPLNVEIALCPTSSCSRLGRPATLSMFEMPLKRASISLRLVRLLNESLNGPFSSLLVVQRRSRVVKLPILGSEDSLLKLTSKSTKLLSPQTCSGNVVKLLEEMFKLRSCLKCAK